MTTVATGQVLLAGNPPAGLAASFAALHEVSRRALGSLTTQDCPGTRVVVPVHVAFRTSVRRQHPDCVFSELNTQPTYPLFTLRLTPHGARRKTRGRAVR
jgi:hypothetical protein